MNNMRGLIFSLQMSQLPKIWLKVQMEDKVLFSPSLLAKKSRLITSLETQLVRAKSVSCIRKIQDLIA